MSSCSGSGCSEDREMGRQELRFCGLDYTLGDTLQYRPHGQVDWCVQRAGLGDMSPLEPLPNLWATAERSGKRAGIFKDCMVQGVRERTPKPVPAGKRALMGRLSFVS